MSIDCSMYQYMVNNRTAKGVDVMSYYGGRISDERFYIDVDKVSSYLLEHGVESGDSVAICLPNFPQAVISCYAVNKIGAIANIIHPLIPPKGLENILRKNPSRVLFIYDQFYPQYAEVLSEIEIEVVVCGAHDYMSILPRLAMNIYSGIRLAKFGKKVQSFKEILKTPRQRAVPFIAEGIGELIAVYLHSGGTTGSPKTVMMSNRAMNSCAHNIKALIGDELVSGDSMLMVLPLFHVFGLGVCMHSALSHNARSVLVPKFSPKTIAKLVKKEKLTFMTGVPSMYSKLLDCKEFDGAMLQSLKYCYCGGDKLKQSIIDTFHDKMSANGAKCKLCEGYGLTEATICTVNAPMESKRGSVGKVIGNCRAGIFDSVGNRILNGSDGEICIGGSSVMSGYYNDITTTNKVMFKDDRGVIWVRTGDIGHIEDSGHVYFVDRKKRMLKISGINVFPSEIEGVVSEYIPEIDKCCAVGCKINGKRSVKLVITLKDDFTLTEKLKSDIIHEVSSRLMKYSVPKEIEVRESLPLTIIGKVDYRQVMAEMSDKKGGIALTR